MKNKIPVRLQRSLRRTRRELRRRLLAWGRQHPSEYPWRQTRDPYKTAVAEMLLRRTRADAVSRVYPKFVKKFPTFHELARARVRQIYSEIASLGIASRAKYIKRVARQIKERHGGILPHREIDLFAIFGPSSRYTVSAIRCFSFGDNVPIFDVNVERVLSRVFSIGLGTEAHKNSMSWEIAASLVPAQHSREYNWALLDLGRTVCTKIPKCRICPLFAICEYARSSLLTEQEE